MTSPRTTGVWISANSAMMLRWGPEPTVRIAERDAPADACRRLVHAALAGGGPDNITVLVAERLARSDSDGDG